MIDCNHVCLRYDAHYVVNDVSFKVKPGDYLCIVGENGSGKTTLMKGILGLIKPASGEIKFDGIKPTDVGYIPQHTVVKKDFPASVYETVLSGCLNKHGLLPFYSRADRECAVAALKKLDILQLKKKSYRELSGGQQQRVLLARALCSTGKLLMLDEPANGLDPISAAQMYELLKKLNDEGITIIMISHDVGSALSYATKILHMSNQALFFGTSEEYTSTDVAAKMLKAKERDRNV